MIASQLLRSIVVLFSLAHLNAEENIIAQDNVDRIEVNHFYDENGRLIFDQVLFYEWDNSNNRYQILAWRLLKNKAQIPIRDIANGGYTTIWHDGDMLRKVYCKTYTETWTQYDPELRERNFLPKNERKELSQWRVGKN